MHPPEASWVAFVTLCLDDCIYAGVHGCQTSILQQRILLTIAVILLDTEKSWVNKNNKPSKQYHFQPF